jgi:hypothetical protein
MEALPQFSFLKAEIAVTKRAYGFIFYQKDGSRFKLLRQFLNCTG